MGVCRNGVKSFTLTGKEMGIDSQIEFLVNEAHNIFNKTSIFEVVDLNKELAKEFLDEAYGNPNGELIDRYLDLVKKLK